MNNTLTKRENLLKILQHGKGEWIPCCFHSANARNIPGQLPERLLHEPLNFLAISKYMGGDILHEISPVKRSFRSGAGIACKSYVDDGRTINETQTPAGSLRSIVETTNIPSDNDVNDLPPGITDVGPEVIRTISSYSVQNIDNYKTLRYIYENMEFDIDIKAIEAALNNVGNDGVVVINSGMPSPLYSLIDHFVGLEKFIYDLYDYPEEVEKTMAVMAEKSYECYQLIASNSPAKIIRCTEDLDVKMISPDLFAQYASPVLEKYAQICHQNGKILMVHSCGHINEFLPEYKRSGIDAIHCLCNPPVGNTPISSAYKILGENTVMMVRPDPNVLKSKSKEEVIIEIKRILNEARNMNNLIIIIPPGRSPLTNLNAALKTIDEFNQNK